MISYERATFFGNEELYTREEFDAAKELWDSLSYSMKMAVDEVSFQDAVDVTRENRNAKSD